jgi:hypothetical protein
MKKWKIDRVAATEVSVNEQGEVVITQDDGQGDEPSVVILPRAQISRLVRYLKNAASQSDAPKTAHGEDHAGTSDDLPEDTGCAKCSSKALGALTLVWSMGMAGQDITSASAVMMCEACSVEVVEAWNDVAEEAVNDS